MKLGRITTCDCCTKQIVRGSGTPDKYVTYGPITLLGINQHACRSCAEDLDENGLFPEEAAQCLV